jgi:hypothetical protein
MHLITRVFLLLLLLLLLLPLLQQPHEVINECSWNTLLGSIYTCLKTQRLLSLLHTKTLHSDIEHNTSLRMAQGKLLTTRGLRKMMSMALDHPGSFESALEFEMLD